MQTEALTEKSSFMQKYSWPLGIVVGLVLFMGMTIYFVKKAFSERVDLVATDYYYRDKMFSERLTREKRLIAKGGGQMSATKESVQISLPAFFAGKEITGTLYAYSPLNPAEDFSRAVTFRGDKYAAPVALKPGQRWRISLDFTSAGEGYYYQTLLNQ